MKPIDSTAEILLLRMLNQGPAKKYIDWAYDMLVAGFDTENMTALAGETESCNRFELEGMVDEVLRELNLNSNNREFVLTNYACFLINKVTGGEITSFRALRTLADTCIDLNYDRLIYDFYLLYHAKDSLTNYGYQYYWESATTENIDEVILTYFGDWKKKYDC